MSTSKKLPTRRDLNEAKGYLEDLFATGNEGDVSHVHIAGRLLDHAQEIRVQRATDRLVLYFNLDDTDGALPEATTDPDGVVDTTVRESAGLSQFQGTVHKDEATG